MTKAATVPEASHSAAGKNQLIRRVTREQLGGDMQEELLVREWLVTNGLGGYASGTISGVATRRYHGLLIAAFPNPLGRRMLLSHLTERLRLADGTQIKLSGEAHDPSDLFLYGADQLTEFRLEHGLPVWRYEAKGMAIEKRVVLPHQQNTAYVIYQLVEGDGPVRLKLMPSLHHRSHDDHVSTPLPRHFELSQSGHRYELSAGDDLPPLRLKLQGQRLAFTVEHKEVPEVLFRLEESRGYDYRGMLYSPGYFRCDLLPDQPVALVASTEPWDIIDALDAESAWQSEQVRRAKLLSAAAPAARRGMAAELVLAADQFIITPVGRTRDSARLHASGDEARTVIAGYYWFTDWGRDTMISLEGLTLSTGRHAEAGYILRTFAHSIRDGLLPNLFPEGQQEGLYHTADATLWFFQAIERYMQATGDRGTLELLLPKLIDIVEHHLCGTRFGIGVDQADGLLRQGADGYQLTWMDAKVDGWVVTPRRGKAVEINALWYNALKLLEHWLREQGDEAKAQQLAEHAARARAAFQQRFWFEEGGYLYDVVDGEQGDDSACRPNQVLAISLTHPVLDEQRWPAVMEVVQRNLLTPVGLRSLAPDHPDYKPQYFGDLRTRDAAYHQGTVWAWLIGPFIDAWLKTYPQRRREASALLEGFDRHLSEGCVGSISEIFDAEPPFTPRGCVAQAWSVAEVLRCLVAIDAASEG